MVKGKGMWVGVKRRPVWNAGRNRNPGHIQNIRDQNDICFLKNNTVI